MASTRASTGNSKPRIAAAVSTTPERKRKATTTSTTATKKPTTTKKSTTTGAGITKKRAPNTSHKRQPHLKDKVEGALEKAEGAVTNKPGKKAAGARKMRGTDGKGARTRK